MNKKIIQETKNYNKFKLKRSNRPITYREFTTIYQIETMLSQKVK